MMHKQHLKRPLDLGQLRLKHMLAYGERDGFTVKNVDNYAGHIEYGEGDETLGIFGHMDVVPRVMVGKQILMNQSLKMAKFMHVVQAMIKAQVWSYYAMKIIKN